ncbi:quinol:electron acceptor oxidoreductase subunit ActD [Methylobacterium flocculans]|uniref:quinol:electron acceptor oxidoreductase subunit ActD n=1 Tax=Methylobacterium flocculans TaxID=2984843 RepID=UPI0021F38F18|nr:quinol:electron acceptor oxidoreductase subunit ActD [Methylobacterium sp. FF17]
MAQAILTPDAPARSGDSLAARALHDPLGRRWWIAFAAACGLLALFFGVILALLFSGVGLWNNNNAVVWALDIASYDWWIGLACGSLAVAGILRLTGAPWRGAITRLAEANALLCTLAAGLYPIIHLGRPWFFYWNLPYPNTLGLWPQFRSPLVWDAIDIVSFLVVTVSLWYIGLLPDLAALRDRAFAEARAKSEAAGRPRRWPRLKAQAYGIAAAGWRGSASHWQLWRQAYRTVALLGLLLVVSLQTGASVMLAGSVLPGWHDTILPVAYLINAVFSGVAVTAALAMLVRAVYGLEAEITERHAQILARLLLGLGLASLYCYAAEFFSGFLHGDAFERATLVRRLTGSQAWAAWTVLTCALLPVHLFWWARFRRSPLTLALVGALVAVGAYADHVMVLVVTLSHDFLPSSAHDYRVGLWGVATFAGSVGMFLVLLLLFLRALPVASITDLRGLSETRAAESPVRDAAQGSIPEDAFPADTPVWGVSAEFDTQADLAAAMRALARRRLHHGEAVRLDAYGPLPMPDALKALARRHRSIRPYALGAALAGGAAFYGMCVYATAYGYVLDVGGRPRFSWPSFVVPSVSFAMLSGTLAVHAVFLFVNRLPRLNHPAFNIPDFGRATRDRYFLAAEARGPGFDAERIARQLAALPEGAGRPLAIRRVPR